MRFRGWTVSFFVLSITAGAAAGDVRLYVDASATGANDGMSWADAYVELAEALAYANGQFGERFEVWVAAGVYRPTERLDPDNPRTARFGIHNDMRVYGGFAGGEAELDERNVRRNVTVLDGDLLGDDGPDFSNYDDNAYHVVVITPNFYVGSLLDGFTIRGGNADGDTPDDRHGGGVAADYAAAIRNCTLIENQALHGGGVYVNGTPLIDCRIAGNRALEFGGGVELLGGAMLRNCFLAGNAAGGRGGALFVWKTLDVSMVNCVLVGNGALEGAGLYFSPDTDAHVSLINCTLYGNAADERGGAIAFDVDTDGWISAEIHNSILCENSDANGRGNNSQIPRRAANLVVSYTASTFAFPGPGNTDADPRFVNPAGADGVLGTLDDNLRLRRGSRSIDSADNRRVPADDADLDLDDNLTEQTPLDLRHFNRFMDERFAPNCGIGPGPIVDMGAYEHLFGDMNCDGVINNFDVDPFVLALTDPHRYEQDFGDCDIDSGDINGDGRVNNLDIDPFVEMLLGR